MPADPFKQMLAAPKTDVRSNPRTPPPKPFGLSPRHANVAVHGEAGRPGPPQVDDSNRNDFFAAAKRAASAGKGSAFLKHNAEVIDGLSSGDRVKLTSIVSPTLGQTERQDLATSYSQKQPVGLAEKIVGVPLKAVYQVAEGLASSPAAVVQAAPVIGRAVYHAAKGGVSPGGQAREQETPAARKATGALNDLGKAQVQSVVADVKDPLGRPGYLLLDALAAANAAAKLGVAAKVLPHVPHERTLKVEGGSVQPQASPATLTRMAQHRFDRYSEAHPDTPVVGAKARAASRIPFERQREHDRAMQPAAPFAAARQKLSRSEDFAFDVIRRYGSKATARIDQEIQFRKDKIATATSLVEKAHQRKRLVQLQLAHAHVSSPSPKLTQALDLGRELAGKAERTKVEVGQLTPETAALHVHEASVAATGRTAGAGAFYAPDTARQPIRSIGQRSRAAVTGKTKPLVKQSNQILFTQGRARAGSKLTLEDYQKTTRYAGHLQDIAEAAKFSKPLNPEIPGGLDVGHRYFNPEGHKIPRSFKEEPAAADLEGLTPKEIADTVRNDHEALMRNTFPDEASLRNLPPEMRAKVSQIDENIARAFEGPGYKPRQHGIGKALSETFDMANDTTKLALVYLSGHYVPSNYAGNLAFGAIHQGVWLPVNLAKASARLGAFEPDVLKMIDAEMGQGASLGLATSHGAPTSRVLHGVAGFMGKLADNGPRRAAWIHEAAKRGYKTNAEVRRLLTDPKLRPVLNQVSGNGEDAMVKFRGMSELERNTIARAVFLYPWVRGATRYGLRLPLDRPGRAALLAHLGEQGHADIQKRLGQLASYLDQLIPVGSPQKKLGTTVQKVINPASVTPFGTARDVVQTVGRTVTGKGQGKQLAQYLQPVIKGGFEAGTGYNTFTGHNYPAGTKPADILRQNLYGGAATVQLYKGMTAKPQTEPFFGAPGKQPNYVQGGGREAVGRFLLGGLYPRELNVPAAQAKGLAERQAGMPAAERAYQTDLTKIRQEAKHFKVPGGVPSDVAQDLRWRRDLDLALSQLRKGGLRPQEKAATAAALFAKRYPQASQQIAQALHSAKTDDDYLALYKSLRAEGTQSVSKWNAEFNAAAKQERAAAG